MPNVGTPGHISTTVSGTKSKFQVIPDTYSMVDVVDFAPRTMSGTPQVSQLGLYTDVGQIGFGHGFGEWEYMEPKSYSYSGQGIDTRHNHIQLFTNPTTVQTGLTATRDVLRFLVQNTIPVMCQPAGLAFLDSSSNVASYQAFTWPTADTSRDMISNGKYLFISADSRMKLAYIAQPSNVAGTVLTFSGAGFEDNDQWATNGRVWIVDGTGEGTSSTITTSTGTTVTVSAWTGDTPTTDSWICLIADTGNDANPPAGYDSLAVFGGSVWAAERNTNYLHFWAETNGSDAEGDGLTDAAVIQVGPIGGTIVNLFPFLNQLHVFREDGIWVVNEQDTDALAYHTLDYLSEVSSSNFATVLVWNNFLIYTIRNNLYKYKTGIQLMTPPVWNDYPPYKQFGNFQGLFARGRHLYCLGQSNAANSDETTEATTGFVSLLAHDGVGWHKLHDLGVTTPSYFNAWLDPVNDFIYMYATTGSSGNLYRVQLQTYSDLAYPDYPTSGTFNLYTSYYDFGMGRIPKSFASLTLHGEFPTGTSVAVSYRTDDTTSWTSLGTFDADYEEVDFAAGVTGNRIQFKLTLATTNTSNTPAIRALIIKTMLRPDVKWGVNCDIIVASDLADQKQVVLGLTAAQIKTRLQDARDSVSPITFVDIYGTSWSAYLASCRFVVIAYEDTNAVQSIAKCTFVMV